MTARILEGANYFSIVRKCMLYNCKQRGNKQEACKSLDLIGKGDCRNQEGRTYRKLEKPEGLTSWSREKTAAEGNMIQAWFSLYAMW